MSPEIFKVIPSHTPATILTDHYSAAWRSPNRIAEAFPNIKPHKRGTKLVHGPWKQETNGTCGSQISAFKHGSASLVNVPKESECECSSQTNGRKASRSEEDGSIQATLGVGSGVALRVDDASEGPDKASHSRGDGVLQTRQAHEPQLRVVRLEHVLMSTLDGVELGLVIVVHVWVLYVDRRRFQQCKYFG